MLTELVKTSDKSFMDLGLADVYTTRIYKHLKHWRLKHFLYQFKKICSRNMFKFNIVQIFMFKFDVILVFNFEHISECFCC